MDNCRQNINRDINNNQNTFSSDDKSQELIKDSVVSIVFFFQ